MPELIQDGPDIPVELMNRRDDGKVIFFCGSGISVNTGLPMFDGLVSQIYDSTAQTPTELEQKLLDKGQLDKVLGLLEGRLNPGRLRREAISILTAPSPADSLATHTALLSLSRHADHCIRLVTTNFDNRFDLADPDIAIDAAPKLPLPKPHGWGSLVHLHGRIMPMEEAGFNLPWFYRPTCRRTDSPISPTSSKIVLATTRGNRRGHGRISASHGYGIIGRRLRNGIRPKRLLRSSSA